MDEASQGCVTETEHKEPDVVLTPLLIAAILLAVSIFAFDYFLHP